MFGLKDSINLEKSQYLVYFYKEDKINLFFIY
jgi:hypothetical protein